MSRTTNSRQHKWDVNTLQWVVDSGTVGSGGGDASAANQVTGNASLTSIDGKLPALSAGRIPVVLPAGGSGLTDTELRATPVPVSGTVGVTGVATAANQTALLTELQLKADLTETQPVSLASVPTHAVTAVDFDIRNLVKAQDEVYATLKTDAGVAYDARLVTVQNASLPVTLATLPALVAGTANIGDVDVLTLPALPAGTNNIGDVDVLTLPALPAGSNIIGTTLGPTLTKSAQGATGYSTQDLKDAGRNQTNYYMPIQIVTTATDALLALTGYKSGALVAATTTPAVVTAGKTYRITSMVLEYTSIVTTEGSVRFTLRANTAGVVAIGSPVVALWEVGQTGSGVSVAGKKNTIVLMFPDGIEFAAGTGIGISQVGLSPTGAAAIAGFGRVTINGYEY